MEYTKLGKSDITVSRICLGTWQASGWSNSNDKSILRTIETAHNLGVTFFDTAEAYGDGHSEHLLGRALKNIRQEVIIATKFSFNKANPDQIQKSVERSLKRLQTDYIDLYQQHWPPKHPALAESIGMLIRLKEEGKIRAIGVSNWMEPEWEEYTNYDEIDCLQPCYSLLWRSIEKSVLALCLKNKISIIPYSPLCQGFLAGRFKTIDDIPQDVRQKNRVFSTERFPEALKVLQVLERWAKELKKTTSQVALRWLLDQPGVTAPIVGASRPSQIEENVGACGWSLSLECLTELADVSEPLSKDLTAHDSLWDWHPRR